MTVLYRTGRKGQISMLQDKKICLDSVDNDTIAYNYDDKTIANATKSTFAETDHSRVKTVSIAYLFKSPKVPPPIFQYFWMDRDTLSK